MKHTLTATDGTYSCERCGQSWRRSPSSACPGVTFYQWRTAPNYLHTYSQLRTKRMKPCDRSKPDGCIIVHDEWCWLYDERHALPRRIATDRQRQALEIARQRQRAKWKCEHCGDEPASLAAMRYYFASPGLCSDCKERIEYELEQEEEEQRIREDCNEAILWARSILARNDWCILDTETTSLTGFVLDLAIIAPDGSILFNNLINPQHSVDLGARAVHRITDEELAAAPPLSDLWPQIQEALAGRSLILTYNAAFDEEVMLRSARRYQLPALTHKWECIMEWYAQYFGEWSDYWGDYKWQPLDGGHRALSDTLAALERLKRMARTKLEGNEGPEGE